MGINGSYGEREPDDVPFRGGFCIDAAARVAEEGVVFTYDLLGDECRNGGRGRCEEVVKGFWRKGNCLIMKGEAGEAVFQGDAEGQGVWPCCFKEGFKQEGELIGVTQDEGAGGVGHRSRRREGQEGVWSDSGDSGCKALSSNVQEGGNWYAVTTEGNSSGLGVGLSCEEGEDFLVIGNSL